MFRDVAAIVSEKTINPDNNRPYTVCAQTHAHLILFDVIYDRLDFYNSKCYETNSLFYRFEQVSKAASTGSYP